MGAIAMYSYAHDVGQEAEDKDQQVISLANLGYIFMDQERFEEAFTAFKSALAINNKFVVARRGLYSNYMARKKFQEALDMIADSPSLLGMSESQQ